MAKPLITCIITAWKEDPPENMIKQILNQTYPNKQIIVVCSELDLKPLKKKYPTCEFLDVPNRRDWGHTKRAAGLAFTGGEFICFCNADDEYDPNYLTMMVEPLIKEKADLAFCDWSDKTINFERAKGTLAIGGMTSGNFVVRASIAKYVGWKYRVYAADWYFIKDLLKEGVQTVYLPYDLLKHK